MSKSISSSRDAFADKKPDSAKLSGISCGFFVIRVDQPIKPYWMKMIPADILKSPEELFNDTLENQGFILKY
jgi:hypothetical protein